jgi:hypothetical protein
MVTVTIATQNNRYYGKTFERGTTINYMLRKLGIKLTHKNPLYLFRGNIVKRDFKVMEDGIINICPRITKGGRKI